VGTSSELRDQVRRLRAEGGTYRSIAAASGLAPATVHDLATGRRNSTPSTTRALGNVTSGALSRARVDAGGTRLRLRALHVMGHGSARIARALGVREMTIRQIVRGDATNLSRSLRDAAADLYDAWWDKRAPERTRAERAAATAARRRAIAGNWCAGAGLDDDELDTPGYKPKSNWKPAAGTGTAPDIHPPAQSRKNNRP
jgi:transcriptional regulator with XRE-family HTH domain